jgi:hypothetical protein
MNVIPQSPAINVKITCTVRDQDAGTWTGYTEWGHIVAWQIRDTYDELVPIVWLDGEATARVVEGCDGTAYDIVPLDVRQPSTEVGVPI